MSRACWWRVAVAAPAAMAGTAGMPGMPTARATPVAAEPTARAARRPKAGVAARPVPMAVEATVVAVAASAAACGVGGRGEHMGGGGEGGAIASCNFVSAGGGGGASYTGSAAQTSIVKDSTGVPMVTLTPLGNGAVYTTNTTQIAYTVP